MIINLLILMYQTVRLLLLILQFFSPRINTFFDSYVLDYLSGSDHFLICINIETNDQHEFAKWIQQTGRCIE